MEKKLFDEQFLKIEDYRNCIGKKESEAVRSGVQHLQKNPDIDGLNIYFGNNSFIRVVNIEKVGIPNDHPQICKINIAGLENSIFRKLTSINAM